MVNHMWKAQVMNGQHALVPCNSHAEREDDCFVICLPCSGQAVVWGTRARKGVVSREGWRWSRSLYVKVCPKVLRA